MKLNEVSKKRIVFFLNLFVSIFYLSMYIFSEVYLASKIDVLKIILDDEYLLSICALGLLVCFNIFMGIDFIVSTYYFTNPLFKKLFHRNVEDGESNK